MTEERKRLGLKRVAEGAVMPWVRGIVAALTKESEFGLLGVGWKTAGCATLARVTLVLVLFYSLCTEDFLQPSHGRRRDIASGKISLEACGDVEKAHHLLRAAAGRPAARRIHSLEIGRIRIRGDVAQ